MRKRAGQNFDGATEETLLKALTAVYHRQGYLKMEMTSFAHGEPQLEGEKVLVPVTVKVTDGPLYHLGSLPLPNSSIKNKVRPFAVSMKCFMLSKWLL